MSQAEILEKLKTAVEEMDSDLAEAAAKEAIAAGVEPLVAINDGLGAGMKTMSDLFDEGEVFVPQLVVAAEAFDAAVAILKEAIPDDQKDQTSKGKVLLYTVQGDIHDIGKNLVALMLKNHGFHVIDLGKDVPQAKILETAKEHHAEFIALSALMTTTMQRMREIVAAAKEEGITAKIIIGGAVITQEYADEIGADGYSKDAADAVKLAKSLM